jgi:hypothetical protein
MIRCRTEVTERIADKKHEDSREALVIAPRRLLFSELVRRDAERWRRIETPDELKQVTERVRRELCQGELPHFVAWICAHHGAGLARAAGLPIAPLKVSLAS